MSWFLKIFRLVPCYNKAENVIPFQDAVISAYVVCGCSENLSCGGAILGTLIKFGICKLMQHDKVCYKGTDFYSPGDEGRQVRMEIHFSTEPS